MYHFVSGIENCLPTWKYLKYFKYSKRVQTQKQLTANSDF